MFWFDELKALIGDVVADTVVIGAGAITTALVPKMIENEKLRIVPQVAGLGIMAYGGYDLYKTLKGIQPEWIGRGETLTVWIAKPIPNDVWWWSGLYDYEVHVTNPYNKELRCWVDIFVGRLDNPHGPCKYGYRVCDYKLETFEPYEEKIITRDLLSLISPLNWDTGLTDAEQKYFMSVVVHDERHLNDEAGHGDYNVCPLWVRAV